MNRRNLLGLLFALPFVGRNRSPVQTLDARPAQSRALIGAKVVVDHPAGIKSVVPKAANGGVIGTITNYHLGNNRAAVSFLSAADYSLHIAGYDLDKLTACCPCCEGTGRVTLELPAEDKRRESRLYGTTPIKIA